MHGTKITNNYGKALFSEETVKVSLLKARAVFLPQPKFFPMFGPCSLECFPPRFQLSNGLERKSFIDR
jgi:hypothetical protein